MPTLRSVARFMRRTSRRFYASPRAWSSTRAAETTDATRGDADTAELDGEHFVSCKHHLRDALAVIDPDWRLHRIAYEDHPLVGKVGIDRPRRIRNLQALLEARAAPRPNLCLEARRQSRLEAE